MILNAESCKDQLKERLSENRSYTKPPWESLSYDKKSISQEDKERLKESNNKYNDECAIIAEYNKKGDITELLYKCRWKINSYDGKYGRYYIPFGKKSGDINTPSIYFNKLSRVISLRDYTNQYGGSGVLTPFLLYKLLECKNNETLAIEKLKKGGHGSI